MLVNFKVALGLTAERQVDLAMRCGVDPTLLSQVINERREASPELRCKLATALGVSERWLFTKRKPRIFGTETSPAMAQTVHARQAA